MKNKNIFIVIITVLILVIVFTLISQSTKNSDRIAIGAVIPQTGFGAYWGKPVMQGIELAKKDLQKEYPDKNIQIIIEDSQSAVPAAVTAAQKLINIDRVDALYSEFSGMSSAISPVAQNANKILVYSTFNQKIVEDNTTSIKTFVSFEVACEKFANHLNDSDKKILIISAIGDAAPYCIRGLEKHIDKDNIKSLEGITTTDFRTILLQNKSFEPDYIIPIMYENGSYALIKQKNELGMKSSFFCYKQDCVTEKLLKELPTEATNNINYFEVPIDESFKARIIQANPDISNDDIQGAANAYQSMMVLGESLAKCPNKDAKCVTENISDRKNLSHPGYKDASFTNRVLTSELMIGVIKDRQGTIIR